jgi:hypothetical protein
MRTKKLRLNRETLRHLDDRALRHVGGATGPRNSCANCSTLCSVGVCGTTVNENTCAGSCAQDTCMGVTCTC